MKQAVVDVADLGSIVLTQNGKVVGYVDVRHRNYNSIEFCGRSVNLPYSRYIGTELLTYHGFACGESMYADTPDEVANVDNFLEALDMVRESKKGQK